MTIFARTLNTIMLLHELELRGQLRDDADIKLQNHGFNKIGESRFGRVYAHPKFDYVVKIYKNDPCYSRFVALAMTVTNPHFPRFRGKLTKIVNGVYAIRMERLKPLLDGQIQTYIINKVRKDRPAWKVELSKYTHNLIEKRYPELANACQVIATIIQSRNCFLDISSNNIMMRGDIPVIIDPVGSHH